MSFGDVVLVKTDTFGVELVDTFFSVISSETVSFLETLDFELFLLLQTTFFVTIQFCKFKISIKISK
jgi:hypothetical protein